MEAQRPNHWTTREVPGHLRLVKDSCHSVGISSAVDKYYPPDQLEAAEPPPAFTWRLLRCRWSAWPWSLYCDTFLKSPRPSHAAAHSAPPATTQTDQEGTHEREKSYHLLPLLLSCAKTAGINTFFFFFPLTLIFFISSLVVKSKFYLS